METDYSPRTTAYGRKRHTVIVTELLLELKIRAAAFLFSGVETLRNGSFARVAQGSSMSSLPGTSRKTQ